MEIVGILIAAAVTWGLWALYHKKNWPPISEVNNASALLNFQPFTLAPGKTTYSYYLAPEGFTPEQVKVALQTPAGAGGPIDQVVLHRKHIPITGPATVPAFADLWAIQAMYTGPVKRVTPEDVLQQGGYTLAPNILPAAQLNALLYVAALNPDTSKRALFLPIGAAQA